MCLVFCCVTPHTPLLMPTIGKERLSLLEKTKLAMESLEKDLYIAQPETILIISPHGDLIPDAVSINLNTSYTTNLEEFGDLVTKTSWKSDMMLIDHIREDFKNKNLPLVLHSNDHLDYGTAVPLHYLTQHLPNVRIIPLTVSHLDGKTHFAIGKELKDEIMRTSKRVAVIASADLSHRVGENSPQGMSPRGVAFDEKAMEVLRKPNPLGVLDLDEEWTKEAQTCGDKVLAVLCGLLEDVRHEPSVLSYEKPFGTGYATAKMRVA